MSESIDDIPADTVVTMTREWHLLFNAGGCNPACHGCQRLLPVRSRFKLSTIKPFKDKRREVMLCGRCDPRKLVAKLDAATRAHDEWYAHKIATGGTGCYRIDGKIVP